VYFVFSNGEFSMALTYNQAVAAQASLAYLGRPQDVGALTTFGLGLSAGAVPSPTAAQLLALFSTTESKVVFGSTPTMSSVIVKSFELVGRVATTQNITDIVTWATNSKLDISQLPWEIMKIALTTESLLPKASQVAWARLSVAYQFSEDISSNPAALQSLASSATQQDAARAVISGVTSFETITTAYPSSGSGTAANFVSGAGSTSGQTFTLTTGSDGSSLVGSAGTTSTAGADTFNAAFTTANGMTFQGTDTINGGGGNDIINISVGATGIHQAASMSGIETVSANFAAAGTVSMLGSSDVTKIVVTGSTANSAVSNIASTAVVLEVSNIGTVSVSDVTFGHTTAAVAGSADSATLNLKSIAHTLTDGTDVITIAGIETLNIVSSTGANTVDTLTTTGATRINVSGDQALTIGAALTATVATLDASTASAAVTATMGAVAAATITGGSGNDVLTISAVTGTVNLNAGLGNDTVTAATNLITTDTLVGGDGTDTLSSTFVLLSTATYTTPTTRTISGFETLRLTDDAAGAITTVGIDTGINTLIFARGGVNTAAQVTFNTGAATLQIGTATTTAAALETSLTVAATDTTPVGTDTLTIINSNLSTVNAFRTGGAAETLATTGYEVVTINTGSYATAVDQSLGTIGVTGSTGFTTAETLNFAGANNFIAGVITADIINASAMTSTTGTTLTTVTGTTATTITGSAGNDILIADTTNNVSVSGGAGNDTITGGAGNDALLGGDGIDQITAAAGNDTITAGAGNDTIVFGDSFTSSDAIDGGDGTDILSVTNTTLTALNALAFNAVNTLNLAVSSVEEVTFSDDLDQTSFDMARLDSINRIRVTDWNGAEALVGLAANTTVILDASSGTTAGTTDLTLTYADATGSADVLNISLTNAADTNFGDITIASIETLNIVTSQVTADAATIRVATFDVTATGLTSLVLSGTESINISGVAVNATTISAAAITDTGATAPTVSILGGSANQSITGSAGADTINGGAGIDTISGGAGIDSLVGGTGADVITGGNGADTITGGSGNDSITLTETTAAVDDVILNYSEAGTNVDTVIGFTTTTTGDEFQLSLAALELAGTSGIHSIATNFQALNANTDAAAAAAGIVQVMTTAAAAANAANIFVLSGSTFASLSEVEDAIETGGSYAIGVSATDNDTVLHDAFIVVWTDGTNAHISSVRIATDSGTTGVLAAGGTVAANLAIVSGVTTIGSTTFAAGNFEWIT